MLKKYDTSVYFAWYRQIASELDIIERMKKRWKQFKSNDFILKYKDDEELVELIKETF